MRFTVALATFSTKTLLGFHLGMALLALLFAGCGQINGSLRSLLDIQQDETQFELTLTSTASEPTNQASIQVTATFSESVTGFDASDLTLVNATVANFSGNGKSYAFSLTPTDQGSFSVSVAAGKANGTNGGANAASNMLLRSYDTVGPSVPIITLVGVVPNTLDQSPTLEVISGVDTISGWDHDEVRVLRSSDNGIIADWVPFTSGSAFSSLALQNGVSYYFTVRSVDALGNLSSEANSASWTASLVDVTPTFASTSPVNTKISPIPVTVSFNFAVTGFVVTDLTLTNASASNFTGSGASYSFDLVPSGQGAVGVSLDANKSADAWNNANIASNTLNFSYDSLAPAAVLSGAPTGTSNITLLNIDVLSTDGLSEYRYKIGDGTISCEDSSGYSSAQNESVNIIDDILNLPDGAIKLCVIGADAVGNWQSYASATEATWTKDALNLIASLSGHPSSLSSDTALNITVGGANVTHYKYKLGIKDTTDCGSNLDYSAERAISALITDDLSGYTDGQALLLCVIGGQSGITYQALAQATSLDWTKDSLTYANINYLGNFYDDSNLNLSFAITIDQARPYDTTLNYAVSGNASAIDHDLTSGSVTIPSGQTSATVNYNLLRNLASNAEKSFDIRISQSNRLGVIPGPLAYQFNALRDADSGAYTTLTKIAVGGQHTCGINASGQLQCWGRNNHGQIGDGTTTDRSSPTLIDSGTDYVGVVAGSYHTCGITDAGVLKCWGYNFSGQVGDDSTTNRPTPVVIDSGTYYSRISAGNSHTCGITTAGVLKCWGSNALKQLGDGNATTRLTPTIINSGTSYSQINAGGNHTCGITIAGVLKCWGYNLNGQLGDGTTSSKATPTVIDSGTSYEHVDAGGGHTCGITSTGKTKCWGNNGYGQLGDGSKVGKYTPTLIDADATYTTIATGDKGTCGVVSGGQLKCWGYNFSGEIGDGSMVHRTTPTIIDAGNAYSQVGLYFSSTCGLTVSGQLKCWGENESGQLGDGSKFQYSSPVAIDSGNTYSLVTAGETHACGMTASGQVKCWGSALSGQLGDGSSISKSHPTLIDIGTTYSQITAGSFHTCGITTSGQLKCWGRNNYGQLGNGSATNNISPIPTFIDPGTAYKQVSASDIHSCGITVSGEVKCWGTNWYGQIGDGTYDDSFSPTVIDAGTVYVQISAGYAHTCGITTAGQLKCWGNNFDGELGDGTTTGAPSPMVINNGTTYLEVAANRNFTCAITTVGVLKCWGKNNFSQLGDGSGISIPSPTIIDSGVTYAHIEGGGYHSCGVTTTGDLKCWGYNGYGELGDGSITQRNSPTPVDVGTIYSQVTGGLYHTCGIASGGQLKCWGLNEHKQLGDGSTTWLPHPILHITEP